MSMAFSSEVETGSRGEDASRQQAKALVRSIGIEQARDGLLLRTIGIERSVCRVGPLQALRRIRNLAGYREVIGLNSSRPERNVPETA